MSFPPACALTALPHPQPARAWRSLAGLMLALSALSACSKPDPASQQPPTPPAAAPATTLLAPPAPAAVTTAPPAEVPLNCEVSSTTAAGDYMAENNSWGRGGMAGWQQCMGAVPHASGGVSARWTWDWHNEGDQVKAYPEVVFGHKPGYPHSSTTQLPRQLRSLSHLQVDYDLVTEREGAGNMSIDTWLTSTTTPTTFAVPPITHEVMVWLEVYGPMYAGGKQVDKVRINGTMYRVFVGEKFGLGWRYVAFAPNSPMQSKASVDMLAFFEYLKGKNLITGDEQVAAVNLGNEIISGAGETRLNHFAVTVK
jgi:hypothetical protein